MTCGPECDLTIYFKLPAIFRRTSMRPRAGHRLPKLLNPESLRFLPSHLVFSFILFALCSEVWVVVNVASEDTFTVIHILASIQDMVVPNYVKQRTRHKRFMRVSFSQCQKPAIRQRCRLRFNCFTRDKFTFAVDLEKNRNKIDVHQLDAFVAKRLFTFHCAAHKRFKMCEIDLREIMGLRSQIVNMGHSFKPCRLLVGPMHCCRCDRIELSSGVNATKEGQWVSCTGGGEQRQLSPEDVDGLVGESGSAASASSRTIWKRERITPDH